MTVVLPFYQADVSRLSNLLTWIGQLGGAKNHSALLVADAATQWSDCVSIRNHAEDVFGSVILSCTEKAVRGWPQGSNALFRHAAIEMKKLDRPWLWLEPDAIPLKTGWLDKIEWAYAMAKTPFMGRKYQNNMNGGPEKVLSGIAVYPPDTINRIDSQLNELDAWDVAIAPTAVQQASDTDLIQWFWGTPKLSPTFADVKGPDSPVNTFTLASLEPEAVLFHRNKDGTLIRLLRNRLFPSLHKEPFTVVMSFFNGDAEAARRTLEWIARLKTPKTHPILLCYEQGVPSVMIQSILAAAHKSFVKVHHSQYRRPPRGTFAPTVAFIHAAHMMAKMGKPWLWMEPDAIPLKLNWLDALQEEYDTCGKPFCGPIVPIRGHMNGTGIYPPNTPELIPVTMKATGSVWDWKMKEEMIQSCHDCSRIFFHVWGVINGKLNPIEGPDANFLGTGLINQIPDSAVIMHRCKDGSIIEEMEKTLCRT